MADAERPASRLEKLARLKSLKSGLSGARASAASAEVSLDSLLGDVPESAPAESAGASAKTAPPASEDGEGESLSAYFEALGFKQKPGQEAPEPAPAPMHVKPSPRPAAGGRAPDEGDLWQDPVRTDAMMETLATGKRTAPTPDPEPEVTEDALDDLDAFLRDIEPETGGDSAIAMPPPSGARAEPESAVEAVDPFDPADFAEFERSAAEAEARQAQEEPPRTAGDAEDDGTLSIVFDQSRAKLLEHVSRQMNCSIDDVVVTAVDWYLDALFGEDGEMMQGNG